MLLHFPLVNLQTGNPEEGYIDSFEIVAWMSSTLPDDNPNLPRVLRGKKCVIIERRSGSVNWTPLSFDEVSERILRERSKPPLNDGSFYNETRSMADHHLAAVQAARAKSSPLSIS